MLPTAPRLSLRPHRAWRRRCSGWLSAALLAAGAAAGDSAARHGRAQDLVGCQLADGNLQCVPGISADPQQQIRILRDEIARDQQLETAVQQSITGLSQLVLQGQALEGALLQASVQGQALAPLPPAAFHWYRKAPGRLRWELIPAASGPSYQVQQGDIAYQLMVVVAVPVQGGSQRSLSNVIGPVMAKGASAP